MDFSGGILDKFRFTIVNDGDTAIEPELRLFLYDSGQSETTNEYTLIKGRFNSTTPLARGKSLRKALTVNAVYDGTSENFKLELWDMILKKRLVTHRTDFSE